MPPEDRHSGLPGGGGGANVKSGIISVSDDDSQGVTFNTPFATVPEVVCTLGPNRNAVDIVFAGSITVAGFTIQIKKGHGGTGHAYDVKWIATDAGDP